MTATTQTCSTHGCDKPARVLGMCNGCRTRWRRATETRRCSVPDCGRPLECRGLCGMHEKRWRKHGNPLVVTAQRGPLAPRWTADMASYRAAAPPRTTAGGRVTTDHQPPVSDSHLAMLAAIRAALAADNEAVRAVVVNTPCHELIAQLITCCIRLGHEAFGDDLDSILSAHQHQALTRLAEVEDT